MSEEQTKRTKPRGSGERSKPSIFWLIYLMVAPLFSILFKYEIRGKLPQNGPFVLAGNHLSELDPVVIGYGVWKMGRIPRFMAKDSLFRVPVLKWLLNASGQIPVKRGRGGGEAVEAAERLMETGGGVIIYPEGTLTREPQLWPMRGKSGAVRLAAAHNIPLVPFAHWGTQAVYGRYAKRPTLRFRTPIVINVGEPMDLGELELDAKDRRIVQEASDRLMERIVELQAELRPGETPPEELYIHHVAKLEPTAEQKEQTEQATQTESTERRD